MENGQLLCLLHMSTRLTVGRVTVHVGSKGLKRIPLNFVLVHCGSPFGTCLCTCHLLSDAQKHDCFRPGCSFHLL